jgi:hypothetical protein
VGHTMIGTQRLNALQVVLVCVPQRALYFRNA